MEVLLLEVLSFLETNASSLKNKTVDAALCELVRKLRFSNDIPILFFYKLKRKLFPFFRRCCYLSVAKENFRVLKK